MLTEKTRDLFAVLGLTRVATTADIKTAHRAAVFEAHPDRNGSSPESHARTREVNEAAHLLLDDSLREKHILELQRDEAVTTWLAMRAATPSIPAAPTRPGGIDTMAWAQLGAEIGYNLGKRSRSR